MLRTMQSPSGDCYPDVDQIICLISKNFYLHTLLLTGYGPFGGTSLLKCAIAKARTELQRMGLDEGALLVFYFRITEETKETFKIEATNFSFGHLKGPGELSHNPDLKELEARANTDPAASPVMDFSLDNPLGLTFFTPTIGGKTSQEIRKRDYDFSQFVADLNAFFKQHKSNKTLRQIVLRLVKSKSLPSRVVFVIDRIEHLETLESLSRSELFSDKRFRVIAVARKEKVDYWDSADLRLGEIGFSKWYVPCLWKIDFDRAIFNATSHWRPELQTLYNLFLRHLEYQGRGSLGNIIAELREPMNTSYGADLTFVDIASLVGRAKIQHNAWIQEVLDLNWITILGDLFGGLDQDERMDRAYIGIYYLLDWIAEKRRFTETEIVDASKKIDTSKKNAITISDDIEAAVEAIQNLLHVLTKNRYLSFKNNIYRVIWNKYKPPKCRQVRLPTRQKITTDYRERRPPKEQDEHISRKDIMRHTIVLGLADSPANQVLDQQQSEPLLTPPSAHFLLTTTSPQPADPLMDPQTQTTPPTVPLSNTSELSAMPTVPPLTTTTVISYFDVFLAHNNQDKPLVTVIAEKLKQRGLNPWLDKEQIPPGRWFQDVIQEAIPRVKSAAIFIGPKGLGRWQALELRSFISHCIEAKLPVIPVLLPGVDNIPQDFLFLKELNCVSFGRGIDDPDALDELEWGITGIYPQRGTK